MHLPDQQSALFSQGLSPDVLHHSLNDYGLMGGAGPKGVAEMLEGVEPAVGPETQ